jgi:hypothetical protein
VSQNKPTHRIGIQIAAITAVMVAIYVFFQFLPDLAPERPSSFMRQLAGDTSPELCDVSNFGFTEVSQGRSPLVMRVFANPPPQPGGEAAVVVALTTPAGRPVREEDLVLTHTEKVHLLIVDSTLEDYHHVHPVPTAVPGEYTFTFAPRHGGIYRVFADLAPVATGRPVQAVADLTVGGAEATPGLTLGLQAAIEDYQFSMDLPAEGVEAAKPALITLRMSHPEGADISLQPVMGAYAHMVAFDGQRSGFAHMHPLKEGLDLNLDRKKPELAFVFFAPQRGTYTVWAQVKIDGRELFAPFALQVR